MFYDIVIHPSRIELVHRFLSANKNEMEEKRLSYIDTDFKFDVNTIENGENYEAVKKIIADMIAPHKEELNTINVILPSSFTQNKEILSSESDSDFSEYIAWEAFRMATDVPEHYKYGHIYSKKEGKIIISLTRKSVHRYFSNLLHDLYSNEIDHKLFSLYGSDEQKQPIEIDHDLKNPLEPLAGSEKETYTPVSLDEKVSNKKSKTPVFILVVFIALSAAALYYFNFLKDPSVASKVSAEKRDFNESEPLKTKTSSEDEVEDKIDPEDPEIEIIAETDSIISADTINTDTLTTKIVEVTEITQNAEDAEDATEPDEDPDPVEIEKGQQDPLKIKAPGLWQLTVSLAKMSNDSVVYSDGSIKIYLNEKSDIEKIKSLDPTETYAFDQSDDILSVEHDSFNFSDYSGQKNFNDFIDIRNDHYIFSPDNNYTIESIDVFESLFEGFEKRNVEFKTFRISKSGSKINFTVSFD